MNTNIKLSHDFDKLTVTLTLKGKSQTMSPEAARRLAEELNDLADDLEENLEEHLEYEE